MDLDDDLYKLLRRRTLELAFVQFVWSAVILRMVPFAVGGALLAAVTQFMSPVSGGFIAGAIGLLAGMFAGAPVFNAEHDKLEEYIWEQQEKRNSAKNRNP
jgi:hypothetical protein